MRTSEMIAKRHPDLDQLEAEISNRANKPDPILEIKTWLKTLTHRQMKDLCKRIFESRAKLANHDSTLGISETSLPDVLDQFAYTDD